MPIIDTNTRDYIREHLNKGFTLQQIQDHFRAHSWTESHINEAFIPFILGPNKSKKPTKLSPRYILLIATLSSLAVTLLKVTFSSTFFIHYFGIFDALLLQVFVLPVLFVSLAPVMVFGAVSKIKNNLIQKTSVFIAHALFLVPGVLMCFSGWAAFLAISTLFFLVTYTLLLGFRAILTKKYLIIVLFITTLIFSCISTLVSKHNVQQIMSPKSTNPEPIEDKRLPLGSTVEVDGVKITVLKTEFSPTLDGKKPYMETFVFTTFKIENGSSKPFKTLYLGTASRQGTYSVGGAISPMPGQTYNSSVLPGQNVEVTYAFETIIGADAIIVNDPQSVEKGVPKVRFSFKIK